MVKNKIKEWGKITIPEIGDYPLYSITIGKGKRRIVLILGLHGDEITAYYVVIKMLELYGDEFPCQLEIIPAINRLGLLFNKRRLPFSDQDLNRLFGKIENKYSQSILAQSLVKHIKNADLIIDLHNWDTPTAIIGIISEENCSGVPYNALLRFGCDYIWLPAKKEFDHSLGWWAANQGIPYCALELQPPWLIDQKKITKLAKKLYKMLEMDSENPYDAPPQGKRKLMHAPCSGLFEPLIIPGDFVSNSSIPIGKIISASNFEEKCIIKSQNNGLVLHIMNRSFVHEGQILAIIGECESGK